MTIGFLLLRVCSVIDHRGRQNLIRKYVTQLANSSWAISILTSSVIYFWTEARKQNLLGKENIEHCLQFGKKKGLFSLSVINFISIRSSILTCLVMARHCLFLMQSSLTRSQVEYPPLSTEHFTKFLDFGTWDLGTARVVQISFLPQSYHAPTIHWEKKSNLFLITSTRYW